jgi:DNA topoisomerase VI subunit B
MRAGGVAITQPALDRLIFTTSRLAEFCSEKELINQTGHDSDDWPLVILKELVNNALDACEEGGTAPVIEITVTEDGIDNGPGIARETVADILDYNTRTSSREAYCSPTRGAQGNALRTVLAIPFAIDGERGETVIESRGVAHRITFSIDPGPARSPDRLRLRSAFRKKWHTGHVILASFSRLNP